MVTAEQAKQLIREWGRRQDEHLGLAGFLDIIANEGFIMKFADSEWHGYAGLEAHQKLKAKFFDESHEYDEHGWEIKVDGDETHVRSKMVWRCRTRDGDAARSELLCADLEHDWLMVTCPHRHTPVIQIHECRSLQWRPGQGPQGDHTGDVHLGAKQH